MGVAWLPLLTLALDGLRSSLSLESQVLLYLLAVVLVAVVGGMAVALVSAVAAAFLINYFFVKPVHTLDVAQGEQALAVVGPGGGRFRRAGGLPELAARRARAAEHAASEAETLSALAGTDLDESETLRAVLERARDTFEMESVALKARDRQSGDWIDAEHVGWAKPGGRGTAALRRRDRPRPPAGGPRGRSVRPGPARLAGLRGVAAQRRPTCGRAVWAPKARGAGELATVDRQRTALLAAVGHDLRTPLAGIKASVSTLRQTDIDWSESERDELMATIEESADRLDSIVANLLDASRLQAGALSVVPKRWLATR